MQQIKSKKRVQELGEVFTAEREVKAMCDLIPAEVWENIESTFLEPTCGNGNFLVEIYSRKLAKCITDKDGVRALASITAVDIMPDNCEESRERLREMFLQRFPDSDQLGAVDEVLQKNIICGDSLEIMPLLKGAEQ